MINKSALPMAPSAVCLGLIAALTLAGCSDSDGADIDPADTVDIAGITDANGTDNTDSGDSTDATTGITGTASSTAGVVCDYLYIQYNASPSVDAMSESA